MSSTDTLDQTDTLLDRIRGRIGKMWGKATTVGLALAVPVEEILRSNADSLDTPIVRKVIVGLAILIVILRLVAPPPRSVSIERRDAVDVDHDAGTITIVKAAPITGVDSKAPGEKA